MSSFFLAKAGLKVALFEKEKLPRYKTCGGGLIHKSINMLPFSLNGIVEKEFFEVAVCDHKIKRSFVVKRDVPIISTVMRENFDYNIIKTAEKQGVEIFSNTKVVDIIDKTSEVLVITDSASYTAKYLIGADGANGITAKTISENRNYRRIPALECEIYLNDILLDKFSRFARFDFGIIHFGYGWVFPKNDHLSVGVLSMETKVNLNKQLRSEEHTSELQSHSFISYAVFCLKKKKEEKEIKKEKN